MEHKVIVPIYLLKADVGRQNKASATDIERGKASATRETLSNLNWRWKQMAKETLVLESSAWTSCKEGSKSGS